MKPWKIVLAVVLATLFSAGVAYATLMQASDSTVLELAIIAGTTSGAVLSLLFQYVPGFEGWFNELEDERQKLLMLVMNVLSGLLIFVISCTGFVESSALSCTLSGAISLLLMIATSIGSNQTLHRILPSKG